MGNKAMIYQEKVKENLKESFIHLQRLNGAFDELNKKYSIPFDLGEYNFILSDIQYLAFCDQIIYRFAKLQDTMGAKLFKSLLLYQGENIDKPFLDILNQLEKMDILDVEEWFEIRDLRNEISHDYDNNKQKVVDILNLIYDVKNDLENILISIKSIVRI